MHTRCSGNHNGLQCGDGCSAGESCKWLIAGVSLKPETRTRTLAGSSRASEGRGHTFESCRVRHLFCRFLLFIRSCYVCSVHSRCMCKGIQTCLNNLCNAFVRLLDGVSPLVRGSVLSLISYRSWRIPENSSVSVIRFLLQVFGGGFFYNG